MNTTLPIFNSREDIVSAVNNNDIVIITAETGSGKSTQVPQYLYSAGYNVIVTQPRRIACVSLANRVAKEMQKTVANVVAYQTAFESTRTEDTRILFCTDGLQLARGIKDSHSVLVIDELHEWNLNIETLVAWIKKYRKDGASLKTVLMSATMDADSLAQYYDSVGNVAQVSVEGRLFPVKKEYLTKDPDEAYLDKIISSVRSGKNVLAFRPGKKEISDTISGIQSEFYRQGIDATVLPMYGELSLEEQSKCFASYPNPKVVVATNIAQTSITIPDINVVVDDGIEKRVTVEDGIENLLPCHISKADVLQRAGRAGRVAEGEYYLCSYYTLEKRNEFSEPEISRLLLDKVVLKLYSVGLDAEEIEFFHQPSKESLAEAKDLLRMLSAIDENGITDLGRALIQYPVSVRVSKIIETAKQYGITDDMIKVAAILENRSLVNFKHEVALVESMWGEDYTRPVRYSDFTQEKRSDLLAELDILDRIFNREYDDLGKAGINKKSFFRIKDYYDKLSNQLIVEQSVAEKKKTVRDDQWYKSFLKCLYAGNPDRIFVDGRYGEYEGLVGTYQFSKHSSIEDRTRVVLAIPRCITYKNRWGYTSQMYIIDNVSTIPQDFLDELLDKSQLKTVTDTYYAVDYFHVCNNVVYMDKLVVDSSSVQISKDHPNFAIYWAKYLEEHPWEAQLEAKRKARAMEENNTQLQEVEINGTKFSLTQTAADTSVVTFDFEYIIPRVSGKMTDGRGKEIQFRFRHFTASSCEELRQKIQEDKLETTNKHRLNQRKIKKIADLKTLETEYLSKLGQYHLYALDGTEYPQWYGITVEKDEVKTARYNTEEDYNSGNVIALQKLFRSYVSSNYPTSKFAFVKNGKAVTNKSTEECKAIFQDYLKDIVSGLTFDNLDENKDYVKQVFEECIGMMEENPW